MFAGGGASSYRVFTSNVGQNTFGPARSLSPALAGMSVPIAGGIAQNTKTGDALVVFADAANLGGPVSIVSAHLSDGTLRTVTGVTTYFAEGLAVDESTDTAISGSLNGDFGVYDLDTGTGIDVAPGGAPYTHPAADSVHSLLAIEEVSGPDYLGQTSNNNALSSILTVDTQGHIVSRLERFNFFNVFRLDLGTYLQLNPTTRTGYAIGPLGAGLAPFAY